LLSFTSPSSSSGKRIPSTEHKEREREGQEEKERRDPSREGDEHDEQVIFWSG
jgi:hypothetical protein